MTALRQLALRATADRVDAAMREYRERHAIDSPWVAGERLLVCVGPDALSERVVRAARRLALAHHAQWLAVYVETPSLQRLPQEARDRVLQTLKLAEQLGAHHTVAADGKHVAAVQELTNGGADVVFDFVAEQGAENEGFAMTRPNGSYYVIGYGGTLEVPTLDIISTERNIIGNIVGNYNELAELMVLAQTGKVTLHTSIYPLDAAAEAVADLDAGRVRGRAILVP